MESSTPFHSSLEVYDWISGFINMERGQNVRDFRLSRMKIMAELAGNPEKCAPAIHCAGSKGKGSVTGMTSAILNAASRQCAVYASPHVSDFRERISFGNGFFNEDIYAKAGEKLRAIVNMLTGSNEDRYALFKSADGGDEPTFFELMTLWFFLCSHEAGADALAIETGMGGRLDATNIIDPLAAIITLIELEHTEYLGNTIAAIAGEKAGIIKNNKPIVLAQQKIEAFDVFKKKADETNSPLFYYPEWAQTENILTKKEGTYFSLKLKDPKNGQSLFYNELRLAIPGEIQAENASLAILALKIVFPDIPEEAVRKGLSEFKLPARFERLPIKQDFIIDGAHTIRSMENTVRTFIDLYGKGGILVFGCASGKDVKSMAMLLVQYFSRIIITTPGNFKKSSPEDAYTVFQNEAALLKNNFPEVTLVAETEKAVNMALEMGSGFHLPVLGTGSFYLAAEFKKFSSSFGSA